jgi:hypothetical protein
VLAVRFIGEHVLCLRESQFQLFTMPSWCHETHVFKGRPVLITSIQWESRICEAVIIPSSKLALTALAKWPADPVTVLARDRNDGFHTIRQYDFFPNLTRERIPGMNKVLPCVLPKACTRIIPVAPSCSRLHVGQHGKGLWFQTDNVETKTSSYPVRCIMGFDVVRPEMAQDQESKANPDANVLHLCESKLYARRCDMGEIVCKKYSLRATDLDDAVGRIAIGDKHGKIEVLDYA